MTGALRASLIVIGDEILDGHTRDANSGWAASWLSERGVPVDRIVTVPDEAAAIDEALGCELARQRPRLVLTSGGIGSTPDDLTMAAVAQHLGVGLEAHPGLDARISGWAERAAADGVTIPADQQQAMRKMAQVPTGAYLLEGPRGLTSAVSLDVAGGLARGGATIVVLPGVPEEFQRLVEEGVAGLLPEAVAPSHVTEIRHPYPESVLAPLLGELVAEHPDVRIGSYPGRECVVRLKGPPDAVQAAADRVQARLAELDGDATAQLLRARWRTRWG